MLGTSCTADEPEPIMATVLPSREKLSSQAPVCISLCLKRSMPGTFSHFNILTSRSEPYSTWVMRIPNRTARIKQDIGFVDKVAAVRSPNLAEPFCFVLVPLATEHLVPQLEEIVQPKL